MSCSLTSTHKSCKLHGLCILDIKYPIKTIFPNIFVCKAVIIFTFEVDMTRKKNLRFSIGRRGYKIDEVESFIAAEKARADETQLSLKERIQTLGCRCDALSDEVKQLKDREDSIKLAIVAATQNADRLTQDVKARYQAELDRLRLFRAKWTSAYEQLKERYHFDKDALNMESVAVSTQLELQKFLTQDFSLSKGANTDEMEQYFLSEVDRLTKQQLETQNKSSELKVKSLKDAEKKTAASTFSLEDATHPKESLAEICRSLGLSPL